VDLPQVPDFGNWWLATEAIVLLGFTGESFDFQPNPKALAQLGTCQAINLAIFVGFYLLYILFSLVLLLNMLIALLGDAFQRTKVEAVLDGRIAYAQCVLRLELMASACFATNTHAGEHAGDDLYVHGFRDTTRNPDGEIPRGAPDDNIFDDPDEGPPKWASKIAEPHWAVTLQSTVEQLRDDVRQLAKRVDSKPRQSREEPAKPTTSSGGKSQQLPQPSQLPPPSQRAAEAGDNGKSAARKPNLKSERSSPGASGEPLVERAASARRSQQPVTDLNDDTQNACRARIRATVLKA